MRIGYFIVMGLQIPFYAVLPYLVTFDFDFNLKKTNSDS